MLILENILSQEIIQKLGWTLVHFIWQATVVALLLAILLRLLRKSTPSLRYIIACLALGLIVLLPVITIQLVPVSAPHMATYIEPAPAPAILSIEEMPAAETIIVEEPEQHEIVTPISSDSWTQRAVGALEPALPYLVSGWLIGVFALSLWHLGGWTQLQRLKRRMVKQVDDALSSKLKVLAQRLRVKQTVQLMESALVQIPTVVGWLRPVILLPASALTGLTSEQLEAILAHELAHIKRFDYLLNMLQTVVEILGFYHPAVWWVSHKIRAERENCCDDLAVAVSGDRVCYARALTSMEEIRAGHGQLAVAATGGNLLGRIRRLVGKDAAEKNSFSWVPAATVILLIIALAIPTTLALTTKSDSMLTETKTDVQVEDKSAEASEVRIVHFPMDRMVGVLKVRDPGSDDDSDRGLLSLPGWVLLGQAQGDVSVSAGKDLSLEVAGDITDFSFLADLKPNDLQVLILSHKGISDEELVHLKGLSGLLGLNLGSTAIKGPGLVHLSTLTSLRKLSLFNTQVSDEGLAHLSTLRSLKYLNLYITQVRGPGLKHLKSLTSLVRLDLAATPITNESLVHLAEMTWLKELELQDTDIGNKGLAYLKPLRSLEELILGYADLKQGYSPITDEGLVYLKELGLLKHLYLLRTRVTDAGLAHLSNLKKLEALLLTETQITGEGLAFLKDLPELKYLDLNKTAVTDKGLVYLKDLKSLRTLYIPAESLSRTDLDDLEKALPNCAINGRKPIATIRPPKPEPVPAENEQESNMQFEVKSTESSENLKLLGLAVAMYADDHDDNLPDSLKELKPYIRDEQDFNWLLDNIKYLGSGKSAQRNASLIPIAYDKSLFIETDATNVLFLDFSVRFLDAKEVEKLDIRRVEFLIDARFLSVSEDFLQSISLDANSPDEAKSNLRLTPEALKSLDFSKTKSLILDERNVSLLLEAVRAHKDAIVLAAPQVLTREGKTAEIRVGNNLHFISGYTEPNRPSEKPQPKIDSVEEGISISLKPKLTPKKNIDMEFELEITNVPGFEERKYKGKYPYKLPSIQSITQSTRYIAHNGQTLLFGAHKIAKQQDGRTEQKDLLVLIKAQTVGSSEQDKSAQVENVTVSESTKTTSDVIIPTATVQRRRVRPKDNEQEKTKSATEQKPQTVQKIFPLQHHDASKMAQILKPLLSHTGHISADERTNSLLVIDTDENLMRIEKIIAAFDVSLAKQTVQKSFKLKYRSPSQMAQILRPLLTKTGHVSADESTGILLLIDTPENLKRIEKIIAAFDVLQAEQTVQKFFKLKYYSTSQMAQILKPLLTKTGYISADENTGNLLVIDTVENLKRIELIITEYDVPKADETVTEIFEIRYGDPEEIVELLKKLINGRPDNGAIIEQGKEPIVLIPEPRRKWIIAKGSPENIKQIGDWIAKLDREEPAPASLEQIDQQIIKQQKILKMRQDYINNDPVVKALSENVANAEKELIVARQQFTQSHPQVLQKARLLQLLKKRLNDKITAVGKSFDDMMLPEPNLPLAPEVPLITNTWLESDMLEVLQDIASMAGIPIIPDETVVGILTAELQNVPLDTALDIVLAGTPYVVKKTPYYYLVASAVVPPEIQKRVYSAKKLSNLGKALLIYANDHEDKYPDSLHHLSEYLNIEELKWVLANVKYLAHGKTPAIRPDAVIAYDKKLLAERKGTNVLFNDCHVDFVKPERLKELGISATAILITTRLLSVSEDFLKDIGLDTNSVSSSDAWSEHLLADSAAEPNSGTYSHILDELHVRFLLRAIQAHKDARMLSAPQVLCQEGKTAQISIVTEEYPVLDYNEPNDASDEPQPKIDYVEIGTHIWLTPKLTADNRRVNLDLKLEMRQLKGIIDGKYKGKYPYQKPIIDVISIKTPCIIPDGKTLLIGGLKIIEKEKEPRAPRLKDLPLIGGLFSSTIKEPRMLLILVKPIINPQQKASKILRGEEDSEEHIKSLGRLLEKKLNRPAD